MKGKIFTKQAATQMLPLVRRIVTDVKACTTLIARHKRAIDGLRLKLESTPEGLSKDEMDSILAEVCEHEDKVTALVEKRTECESELEELGAFLGDAEEGIVKFYGEINTRIVYLTWKLGDPEVAFWHEIEGDYEDRQPIGGDEMIAQNAEA